MNLDQLTTEIQNLEASITDQSIKNWLIQNGRSAESITGSEVLTIASELATQTPAPLATTRKRGNLKKTQQSAPLANPVETGDRQARIPEAETTSHGKAAQEMNAFEQSLVEGKNRYVQERGDRILAIVNEAPVDLARYVSDGIKGGEANPELFRTAGRELSAVLFGGS